MSTIVHTHGREDSSLGSAFVVKEDLPECETRYELARKHDHGTFQLTLVSGNPVVIPVVMIHVFEARGGKVRRAA